jgi:hypothetical protein
MNSRTSESRRSAAVLIGLLMASALFLTACGGDENGDGGSESQAESTGPGPLDEGGFICELAAILLGGECVGVGNTATCNDDPFNNLLGLPPCSDPPSTGSGTDNNSWITPWIYGMPDTEPNNSISTPAQARLDSQVQKGGRRGFSVNGSFNTLTDPADVFVFTLTASANIEFTLCFGDTRCRADAGNRIDVGTAYISVLDQDGEVIWSASDFAEPGNFGEFWLEAGVPHYVMLVAADTMGSDLNYRLQVVEAQDQEKKLPPQPEQHPAPNAPTVFEQPLQTNLSITLDWLPPTEYDDGAALVDLAGYGFYISRSLGGPYTQLASLDVAGATSHTINLPEFGGWYVVVTAVDAAGREGGFSNEIYVDLFELPPDPTDDGGPV